MESRSEEWEIVDYCPCLEETDLNKSRLSRVIDTALNVGKKLIITGVVISSAPLLLPPLVVFSALGFAFSIPFGAVFASYACTQKLMSKLLPSPSPPALSAAMLGNQTVLISPRYDEEDHQQPVIDAENNEEKEQNQAIKDGIEMRIGLVDNHEYDGGVGHGDNIRVEGEEGLGRDELDNKFILNNVQGGSGLDKELERDRPSSLEQGEDENSSFDVVKSDDSSVVAPELTHTGDAKCEGENKVGNQAGLSCVQVQTDDHYKFMENAGEENPMNGGAGRQNVSQDKSESETVDKTITEIERTGKDQKRPKDSKGKSSSKEIEKQGKQKTLAALKFPGKRKESEGDKSHEKGKELPEDNKSSSENNVEGEPGLLSEKFTTKETSTDESGSVLSETKQAGEKGCVMLGRTHVGFKDGAVMETAEGESANDGDVDIKIEQCTVIVHDDPGGENQNDVRMAADDGDYSLEVAALTGMPVLKHDEEIRHSKEEKDAPVVDNGLRSDEELFRDEKIWEKIDAIRAIVGFKAPRHPSFLEELKALYLFAGIEPPSTTTDPCDFAEFYHKLCFLMSVIGLK